MEVDATKSSQPVQSLVSCSEPDNMVNTSCHGDSVGFRIHKELNKYVEKDIPLASSEASISHLYVGITELSLLDGVHAVNSGSTFPPLSSVNNTDHMASAYDSPWNSCKPMEHSEASLTAWPVGDPNIIQGMGRSSNQRAAPIQPQSPARSSHEGFHVSRELQRSSPRTSNVWDISRMRVALEQEARRTAVLRRRNVVRLCWTGNRKQAPKRTHIVRDLLLVSMAFRAEDLFAVIDLPPTEFDVSFREPESLHKFWSMYKAKKTTDLWRSIKAIPISRPEIKCVTIMFKNETVSTAEILAWLKRRCTVLSPMNPLKDAEGLWTGAWRVQVKLNLVRWVAQHLPCSFFIGDDMGFCFYEGQPQKCFKCGSTTHFARACAIQACSMYGDSGHLGCTCYKTQCQTCAVLGHTLRLLPDTCQDPYTEQSFIAEKFAKMDVAGSQPAESHCSAPN